VPEILPVLRVRDPMVDIGGEPFSPDNASPLDRASKLSVGAPLLFPAEERDQLLGQMMEPIRGKTHGMTGTLLNSLCTKLRLVGPDIVMALDSCGFAQR
jgi:hypothetical protein